MLTSANDIVIIALTSFACTSDGCCYEPAVAIINVENSIINLDDTIYSSHSVIHHHRTLRTLFITPVYAILVADGY